MNLHEYQTKLVLSKYGIFSPPFYVISDLSELESILQTMDKAVIKVQVHAGGRGKAGGVKFAKNRQEILQFSKELLKMKIINEQTGPEGMIAHQLLITEPVEIQKEYYLGAVIDRKNARSVLMASPEGGINIEEVAEKSPERVVTIPFDEQGKIHFFHLIELAKVMGWDWKPSHPGIQLALALARAFTKTDASLLEINPLVESNGAFLALDAKLTIDDNALFRQKSLLDFYDPSQLPLNEARAKEYDLSYVTMEGDIGCMVNGAGLAMATMDIIQLAGGKPANFLDVGGGATEEKIAEGFKLILGDSKVKAILVNIFGGIMNCTTIAAGIISAANKNHIHVPLIVRMEGTNVEQGKKMLADSKLNIILADTLSDAARKAVVASREK